MPFGPPPRVTEVSPCPWVDHLASGLRHVTSCAERTPPCSDSLSLRLRRSTDLTSPHTSNSPAHYAKGTPSPNAAPEGAARAPTVCRHTVSGSATPRLGFFSPFPHGTSSLSVTSEYLALGGGPPGFTQGFSCPVLLGYGSGVSAISPTGLSPSLVSLSSKFGYDEDW